MAEPPRIRQPKLAHVAVVAGVSLGTASDALRGKGRISDETRSRVLAAAQSMGYRPNANARVLAMGHSQIVALVAHGPGPAAAPRIYWPRLQAAFTERLLEHAMVACTMTLDDLHQLDGLPFDLIVYAGLDASGSLPAAIRADYRVLDLDIVGDSPLSRTLRGQFADICRAVLDHLAASGAQRPGLVVAGGAGAAARVGYESWCTARGTTATTIDAARPDRSEALNQAIDDGMDAVFSVLADQRWLADTLLAAGAADLPVVALGPRADAGTAVPFAILQPDGHSIGVQIADAAIAALRRTPPPDLRLEFLLDGAPFPAAGPSAKSPPDR